MKGVRVCLIDVYVDIDAGSFDVFIVGHVAIHLVDCDDADDLVARFDVDQCNDDVIKMLDVDLGVNDHDVVIEQDFNDDADDDTVLSTAAADDDDVKDFQCAIAVDEAVLCGNDVDDNDDNDNDNDDVKAIVYCRCVR